MPETTIQQATKPLSYYLSPAYDITLKEGQDWLVRQEHNLPGIWVLKNQLDWKRAEDLGFFLEVPFKPTYQGHAINPYFESTELAKLNLDQTEWHLTISKDDNKYAVHISGLVPSEDFSKGYPKQSLLSYAKQRNGTYSGLWLSFNGKGDLVSGMEVINGHGKAINTKSKKLPSTELEEVKRDL